MLFVLTRIAAYWDIAFGSTTLQSIWYHAGLRLHHDRYYKGTALPNDRGVACILPAT
jgi:hypothetical protein